jgi:hypothetical protein
MRSSVTPVAQGDEILLCIVTERTTRLHVMNVEIAHRPAALTAPAISPQHLFMQLSISLLIEGEPGASGADGVHEAIRALSKEFLSLGLGKGIKQPIQGAHQDIRVAHFETRPAENPQNNHARVYVTVKASGTRFPIATDCLSKAA